MRFDEVREGYSTFAVVVVNTCVAAIVVNVVIGLAFIIREHIPKAPQLSNITNLLKVRLQRRGWNLDMIYPGKDLQTVDQLLTETWTRRRFKFDPYTEFIERPYKGKFVNVSEAGFRISKGQGPWPPSPGSYNIFMFGGSTMFSYGVPDDESLPSYFQEELTSRTGRDIRVYNFGSGYYHSTQERARFVEMLAAGWRPDFVIFMDGINDLDNTSGQPVFTPMIDRMFEANQQDWPSHRFLEDLSELPFMRLARALGLQRRRNGPPPIITPVALNKPLEEAAINRYFANKLEIGAVAKQFKIPTAFIWEPVPWYKYNVKYYLMGDDASLGVRVYSGYTRLRQIVEAQPQGPDFLWCADFQESLTEPAYVDTMHYSAYLNRQLAQYSAELIVKRGLIPHK